MNALAFSPDPLQIPIALMEWSRSADKADSQRAFDISEHELRLIWEILGLVLGFGIVVHDLLFIRVLLIIRGCWTSTPHVWTRQT